MSDEGTKLGKAVLGGATSGAIAGAITGPHGAVVGAGLGALGGGAAHLVGLAADHLRNTADRRLFEAQERLAAEAVESVREPIEKNLEALKDAVGEHEAAASVVPVLREWSSAWFDSDGKKQRVIMAALVSAFDPESHQAAMSQRFFRLLKHLDYPEIHQLCSQTRALRAQLGAKPISMTLQLIDEDSRSGDERTTHRLRLAEFGLLRVGNDHRTWSPTWLGLELVSFLERGGYNSSSSPSDEPATG